MLLSDTFCIVAFYFLSCLLGYYTFSGFKQEALEYFLENQLLQEYEHNSYRVAKTNLFNFLFENKVEVISKKNFFKKIDELRYTTQKKSIEALIDKLLNPTSNDEKKFIKSQITLNDENKLTKLEQVNKENLYKFFAKGSKTEHKKIQLKLDKTWRMVAKYLSDNKDYFIKEVTNDKDKKRLVCDYEKLIVLLKEFTIFKITHKRKRKVKKEYSLPLKDTTEKPFLLKRKSSFGDTIYQTVFANNSARGFVDGYYIHTNHKNIIPLKFDDYLKAFENETHHHQ